MIYLSFLILGIILTLISLIWLRRILKFVKNAEYTIGKVIELEEKPDDGGFIYHPVFKFSTAQQETYIYRYPVGSSPSDWSVGDELTFIYSPENPTEAKPYTYTRIFRWTILLLAAGVTLTVIGAGYCLLQGYLH